MIIASKRKLGKETEIKKRSKELIPKMKQRRLRVITFREQYKKMHVAMTILEKLSI